MLQELLGKITTACELGHDVASSKSQNKSDTDTRLMLNFIKKISLPTSLPLTDSNRPGL